MFSFINFNDLQTYYTFPISAPSDRMIVSEHKKIRSGV